MLRRSMLGALTFAIVLAVFDGTAAQAGVLPDPMHRPATKVRRPDSVVLVDVARAGSRLVAAGERGVIVLSDDNGVSWRQAEVPVSVTLTAVRFLNADEGWAVGHSGIVLHTTDSGRTWTKQLDGIDAARLLLDAAPPPVSGEAASSSAAAARRNAQQFVDDGPDKPFLDICFGADGTLYVSGAYGLLFTSRDRGHNWRAWLDHVDNPDGLNLYAMRRSGDVLYLAGEQGYFARSLDEGQHFERISTPYHGSYFTLNAGPGDTLVVAGLRGGVFASTDRGTSWHAAATGANLSVYGVATLADGKLLLADERGNLLVSRDNGQRFTPVHAQYQRLPTAALVEAADGSIVTVGARGIYRIKLVDYQ
jgi:photosystem II stability/assembly factor-like uncharacterized protein